jgi:predicted RNA-binding protein with RPS1 domain
MKKILLVGIGISMLTACVQNSSEYKQLKSENDSLKLENTRYVSEINDMLSVLNDIEVDIQSIRDAENYLHIQQQKEGELSPDVRRHIKENMQLISETLKKNKQQLSQLEEKLKSSNIQSAALKKTVSRLTSELDQKVTMIVALQEDLAKKNVRIQELDQQVTSLTEDVEGLSLTATAQAETLKSQDKALNSAFYCFGTAKELKGQKILTGGGLFSKYKVLQGDFNRDYFIPIDIRKVTEISLFAEKARLKSNHPAGSYEFIKDEDRNLIFKITDVKAFWSLGKYLVLEVG